MPTRFRLRPVVDGFAGRFWESAGYPLHREMARQFAICRPSRSDGSLDGRAAQSNAPHVHADHLIILKTTIRKRYTPSLRMLFGLGIADEWVGLAVMVLFRRPQAARGFEKDLSSPIGRHRRRDRQMRPPCHAGQSTSGRISDGCPGVASMNSCCA
jgi:hypothetical protein